MPLLAVKTNVSIKDASKLLNLLTDAVVNGTGKPKDRICVLLDGDKTMAFGGSTEPSAMISFGKWFGCRASLQPLQSSVRPFPSTSLSFFPQSLSPFLNSFLIVLFFSVRSAFHA